ncbi:MAG: hypothetical protein OEZ36_07105 [Spirochaetota bacterium]|nr:hypothetical protein [Spirochaetota bacterium]
MKLIKLKIVGRLFFAGILMLALAVTSCGSKEPASVKKRKSLEKEISGSNSQVKLSPNESLSYTIKNQALFREYNIEKYDHLDQNSLFEKINGAADGYVKNHGFKGCGYLELKHKLDNVPVIIYVMDMDKSVQGFGIYSSERNRENEFVKVGSEGYFSHSGLSFWKAKYYVKVELQKKMDKEKGRKLLLSLGERIARQIPEDNRALAGFSELPEGKRLDKGLKYYMANYEGLNEFRDVYEASYNAGKKDSPAMVFRSTFKSGKAAKAAIEKYVKNMRLRLLEGSKSVLGGELLVYQDTIEKSRVVFFLKGQWLYGVKGFSGGTEESEMIKEIALKAK